EALDAFLAQLELQSPHISRGVVAVAVAFGQEGGIPLNIFLLRLHGLVVDTAPHRGFANLVALHLTVDAVAPDLSMRPLDKCLLVAVLEGGMPAALPIGEQVETRAASILQRNRSCHPLRIVWCEEGIPDESARGLTRADGSSPVGMQPKGAHPT